MSVLACYRLYNGSMRVTCLCMDVVYSIYSIEAPLSDDLFTDSWVYYVAAAGCDFWYPFLALCVTFYMM